MRKVHLGIAFLVIVVVPAIASTAYSVAVLPAGATYTSLNDNGQVAGHMGADPVISTVSGITIEPIPSGLTLALATSINDNGVIAGFGNSTGGPQEAFIGDTALGLSGLINSTGEGLNDAGQLAGVVDVSGGNEGFIATTSGGYQFTGLGVAFFAINSAGIATGFAGNNPVYGTPSGLTAISGVSGEANGINSSGNVCGSDSGVGPFFFNVNTSTVTLIPSPAGFNISGVQDGCINDGNQVVATAFPSSGPTAGIVWDPINGTQLLSNLVPAGWTITTAVAIANNGDILAQGSDNGGPSEFVLLQSTTPEPSTWGVLALLTGVLTCIRRFRRSR